MHDDDGAEPGSFAPEQGSGGADTACGMEPLCTWRYWARRLLVCNPFFLCSAALLLFGVNRLSIDPGFLTDETHNLLFNFFALQCYEGLVVVTAVVLARRRIWYDSALLVVLDSGLVLVPFMLISQAALIGGSLATTLTLAGGLLAVSRLAGIRRWYPRFNLPPRALLLGSVILAMNAALPRIFRPLMEADVQNWKTPNLIGWYAVLPVLALGAHLLPRPARYGGLNPERHWLPLFSYGLWIGASAVHLWCVQHICDLPFTLSQLAPLVWVAAWTLRNRIGDCLQQVSPRWEKALLVLAVPAPLFAFAETRLFVILSALNTVAYVVVSLAGGGCTRRFARHLAMASFTLLLAGLPVEWGTLALAQFGRLHAVALATTVCLVAYAIRSNRLELGLGAAVAVALDVGWLQRAESSHPALQAGLVFLLLHSLRWRDGMPAGIRYIRLGSAGLWVLDAIAWTSRGDRMGAGITIGAALLVGAAWMVDWWRRKERGSLVLPMASALTLLSSPVGWLVRVGSLGVLAVVGSLILFAGGIACAWTRHRWDHRGLPRARRVGAER